MVDLSSTMLECTRTWWNCCWDRCRSLQLKDGLRMCWWNRKQPGFSVDLPWNSMSPMKIHQVPLTSIYLKVWNVFPMYFPCWCHNSPHIEVDFPMSFHQKGSFSAFPIILPSKSTILLSFSISSQVYVWSLPRIEVPPNHPKSGYLSIETHSFRVPIFFGNQY